MCSEPFCELTNTTPSRLAEQCESSPIGISHKHSAHVSVFVSHKINLQWRVAITMELDFSINRASWIGSPKLKLLRQELLCTSHIRQTPSQLADSSIVLSLLNCTEVTGSECAGKMETQHPLLTSQIRIDSSQDALAISESVQLNSQHNTDQCDRTVERGSYTWTHPKSARCSHPTLLQDEHRYEPKSSHQAPWYDHIIPHAIEAWDIVQTLHALSAEAVATLRV